VYRRAVAADGFATDRRETNVELSYRFGVTKWLSLQGSVQHITNPDTNPALRRAVQKFMKEMAGAQLGPLARAGQGWRRRIPLPSYPFERQRYWIDRPELRASAERVGGALSKRPEVSDWFYLPSFKPALRLAPLCSSDWQQRRRFWVFGDGVSASRQLSAFLERAGQEVVTMGIGPGGFVPAAAPVAPAPAAPAGPAAPVAPAPALG